MSWLARHLLALYPRSWRDRYEAEVRALLDQHRVRMATLADLVAGAIDARLDPAYRSEEKHMPSSSGPRRANLRCSFCGKGEDQVRKLVAGPGVFICDRCIALCNEVLATDDQPRPDPPCQPDPRARRSRTLTLRSWLRNLFQSAAPGRARDQRAGTASASAR